jgi:DNA repair protein RadC
VKEFKNIYFGSDFKNEDVDMLLYLLFGGGKVTEKSKKLSKRLLSSYDNNLKKIINADFNDLIKIIPKNEATVLMSAFEFARQASIYQDTNVIISSPGDAASLLINEMRYYKKEVFKVLLLDTKNRLIKVETISSGILDASLVHPREIFYSAIKETASSIIIVHNHPSGNPIPSTQDIEITKNIMAAGKIINIEVMDHLIIGDGRYISMKEKKFV